MSSSISTFRAVLSCTPFIGSVVGIYNSIETRSHLAYLIAKNNTHTIFSTFQQMGAQLTMLGATMAAAAGSKEDLKKYIDSTNKSINDYNSTREKTIYYCQRKASFSQYGVISNSLSGLITIVAMKVFKIKGPKLLLACLLTTSVLLHHVNWKHYSIQAKLLSLLPPLTPIATPAA